MLFTWIILIMAVMFMSKVKQTIRRRQRDFIQFHIENSKNNDSMLFTSFNHSSHTSGTNDTLDEGIKIEESNRNHSIVEETQTPYYPIHEEIDIFMYHEFDNPLMYVAI